MTEQESWSIEELAASDLSRAALLCLPRFAVRAGERLALEALHDPEQVPEVAKTLVVLGGGSVIDKAKLWRYEKRRDMRLIAVPSLWGSGAEASRVAAVNRSGKKHILVDDSLVPEVRVLWPGLIDELPDWRAREACGDAWAHALEGWLSPLADDGLRREIAVQVSAMLELPLGKDLRWFEPSARVCRAQGRASVGLIHGIAHTLEGPLAAERSDRPFGHARLCSILLKPVLALDRELSPKFDEVTAAHGIDGERLLGLLDELFDEQAFERILPHLEEHWPSILRDPCTRTNSALVRPAHLSFFTEQRFR